MSKSVIWCKKKNRYELESVPETMVYGDAAYLAGEANMDQKAYLSSLVGKVDQIGNPGENETWNNFPILRIVSARVENGYVFVDVEEQGE